MQDCGRLCANETVAAVVRASASVTASFARKDDVIAHLRGSGGRRAGCPTRRVPLGKLHQRADRKSAACRRSMPPAPPRVREETHKPDELTRAARLEPRIHHPALNVREPETRTKRIRYCG